MSWKEHYVTKGYVADIEKSLLAMIASFETRITDMAGEIERLEAASASLTTEVAALKVRVDNLPVTVSGVDPVRVDAVAAGIAAAEAALKLIAVPAAPV